MCTSSSSSSSSCCFWHIGRLPIEQNITLMEDSDGPLWALIVVHGPYWKAYPPLTEAPIDRSEVSDLGARGPKARLLSHTPTAKEPPQNEPVDTRRLEKAQTVLQSPILFYYD